MATAQQVCDHYDLPAALFEQFLDREFHAYSAGRWQPGDRLEEAQRRNLRTIAGALDITAGSSVLDIGCGWGPFTKVCIRDLGVHRYVGLTPSRVQIASVESRIAGDLELYPVTWQEFPAGHGEFDAVVALESIEHIASLKSRRNGEAVDEYRRFFDFCARASKPSAGLYVQTSVVRRLPRTRSEAADVRYILDEVFYGSALADLDSLERASAALYSLVELEWSGEDYLKTLQSWRQRLLQAEDSFVARFGAGSYAHFDRYLATCARLFDSRVIDLLRVRFKKRNLQ